MNAIELEQGFCVGFGATNARTADYVNGDIVGFEREVTPHEPDLFFGWMARQLLQASENGAHWAVVGYPGPVSADGEWIGPFANLAGMNDEYSVRDHLLDADPAIGRLLDDGFTLLSVNDGTLAAHAATHITERKFDKTAALIIGTGVGAGVVTRDKVLPDTFRNDVTSPYELGHIFLSTDVRQSIENTISGPAIEREFGDPKDLSSYHPVWRKVSHNIVVMCNILGMDNGVDVVVPTGGVGVGATAKYGPPLLAALEDIERHANETQRKFMPEVVLVPSTEADSFEMRGAEGVMLDHVTRQATS